MPFVFTELFLSVCPVYENHNNNEKSYKHSREAKDLEPHVRADSDYRHNAEKRRARAQDTYGLLRTESRIQKPVVQMLSVCMEGAFTVGDPAKESKTRIHKRIDQRNKRYKNCEYRVEFEKSEHRSCRQDISKKL